MILDFQYNESYHKFMMLIDEKFLELGVSQLMIDTVPRPKCSRGTNSLEYINTRYEYLDLATDWIHTSAMVPILSFDAIIFWIKSIDKPRTRKHMNRDILLQKQGKEKSNA